MKKLLVGIIFAGAGIDQLLKLLVKNNMELYESIHIIPKVFTVTYVQNQGAAFGMLSNHQWVFMTISFVALIYMSIYLLIFCNKSTYLKIGLALIISGGLSNMIDRLMLGYVVDFIDLTFIETLFNWSFAIFNVADCFICVGTINVIYYLVRCIVKEFKIN